MTRIVFEDVSKIYGDRPRQVQQAHGLLHLTGAVAVDIADILEHAAGHLFPLRP